MTRSSQKEQGYVLVIALFLMLGLTFLGVAATSDTSFQLQMARNHTDRDLAFQAAEQALRVAEQRLEQNQAVTLAPDRPGRNLADWQGGIGRTSLPANSYSPRLSQAPVFVVSDPQIRILQTGEDGMQAMGDLADAPQTVQVFPVTSLARGSTDDSVVILRSFFAR